MIVIMLILVAKAYQQQSDMMGYPWFPAILNQPTFNNYQLMVPRQHSVTEPQDSRSNSNRPIIIIIKVQMYFKLRGF